eukprot:7722827-Karenia_brevis.AAC.1
MNNKVGVGNDMKNQGWRKITLAERWSNPGVWHVYTARAEIQDVEASDRDVVKSCLKICQPEREWLCKDDETPHGQCSNA